VPNEPREPAEVEVSVAGHCVRVRAAAPMGKVAETALDLFRRTSGDARRIPVGFDTVGGQIELADPPAEGFGDLRPLESPEDRNARLGRLHPARNAAA
jgi:hypothetical protein